MPAIPTMIDAPEPRRKIVLVLSCGHIMQVHADLDYPVGKRVTCWHCCDSTGGAGVDVTVEERME